MDFVYNVPVNTYHWREMITKGERAWEKQHFIVHFFFLHQFHIVKQQQLYRFSLIKKRLREKIFLAQREFKVVLVISRFYVIWKLSKAYFYNFHSCFWKISSHTHSNGRKMREITHGAEQVSSWWDSVR